MPGGWGIHQTGAVCRSSANSGRGTRCVQQIGVGEVEPVGQRWAGHRQLQVVRQRSDGPSEVAVKVVTGSTSGKGHDGVELRAEFVQIATSGRARPLRCTGVGLSRLRTELERVLVQRAGGPGRPRARVRGEDELMAAEPVIVEAVRTPIGKRGGALANLHPAYLLGETYRELLGRTDIHADCVEQIVGGTVTHAGEQSMNPARTAWLAMGLPYETAATTVDCPVRLLAAGLHMVANMIAAGVIDVGISCGVEAMSRVPLGLGLQARARASRRPDEWNVDLPEPVRGGRADRPPPRADPRERRLAGAALPGAGRGRLGRGALQARDVRRAGADDGGRAGAPGRACGGSSTGTRGCGTRAWRRWPG